VERRTVGKKKEENEKMKEEKGENMGVEHEM